MGIHTNIQRFHKNFPINNDFAMNQNRNSRSVRDNNNHNNADNITMLDICAFMCSADFWTSLIDVFRVSFCANTARGVVSLVVFLFLCQIVFLYRIVQTPNHANVSSSLNFLSNQKQNSLSKLDSSIDLSLKDGDGRRLVYESSQFNQLPDVVSTNLTELTTFLKFFNKNSRWLNKDKFKLERNFVPLIMRANRRIRHLRAVLKKLSQCNRINRTVLIVSHDSLDIDMMNEINNIDFMIVKQIINPNSANILLDRFPGTDANAHHSIDRHGHPREEGKFPGIKHHFLWHLTEVWRRQVPSHVQDILLLEDDQLPTFDFYVAMKSLLRVRLLLCEDCGGVLIGHHSRSGAHNITQVTFGDDPFGVGSWGHDTNLGMTVSRPVWRSLLDNALEFCSFDDYNWDLSLERLRATEILPPFLLSMRWSRLLHYGLCGATHESRHKKDAAAQGCESAEADVVSKIEDDIEPVLRQRYAEQARAYNSPENAELRKAGRRNTTRASRYAERDQLDVFAYSDDDDGAHEELHERMIAPLWRVDSIRVLKPLKHDGWGGFGRLDQNLCVALSGVAPQLLSPVDDEQLKSLDPTRARQLGCYGDAKWERDLGHMAGMVGNHSACFAACRMARLPYAGLQFGGECWCGLQYGLHEKYSLSQCNMTCDSKEPCGSANRALLFDIRNIL